MYKSLIIFSFVGLLFSTLGFFLSANEKRPGRALWLQSARLSFYFSTILLIISFIFLVYFIVTHQFQYNYVYAYSSMDLPLDYLVSTFWAGQEGSFLLWIFFLMILGIFLIKTAADYEPHVMTIFSLATAFLVSMILGVKLGDITLGSSPFKTIYEAFPGQVPTGFIPADGRGLNPLLQNYWMTIHPPILFTGFASSLVPFAFAIAALWRRKYDEWIHPAFPWTIWAALSLGTGIMLGGYWAYETLGWGGYWAWDPVENGSFVPWLATVACFHSMLVQRKTKTLKRFTIFTALLGFVLVVYSTFLTRSGVLADFSVHSFTGLGLYWQLLIFILVFFLGGVGFLIYRWKSIPYPTYTNEIYSREFAIISGALILVMLSFAVILGTSLPIYSHLIPGFGDEPRTLDPSAFNTMALPLGILIALLMGVGQLLWFSKTEKNVFLKNMFIPFATAVVATVVLIGFGVRDLGMILLAFGANFALFSNISVLLKIVKGNPKLAGGSIAHIGIAIMFLGFISSGKYDTVGNFTLPKDQAVSVFNYKLTFLGESSREGKDAFLIKVNQGNSENELRPMMYFSEFSQSWMRSPDILINASHDFYVSAIVKEESKIAQDLDNIRLKSGESIIVGDYTLTFDGFKPVSMTGQKVHVQMNISLTKDGQTETIVPEYGINEKNEVVIVPAENSKGAIVKVKAIDASNKQIVVSVSGNIGATTNAPSELLVIEASIKPYISLVWLGTVLMIFGLGISVWRRWKLRSEHLTISIEK